jgi:hypothetical protein
MIASFVACSVSAFGQQCLTQIKFGPTTAIGSISSQNEVDCFWFDAVKGDLVRLNCVHNGNQILLVAEILDPARQQIAFKPENALRIEFSVATTGIHRIQLRDRDRYRQGNYELQIRRLNNPEGCHDLCYSFQATRGAITGWAREDCYRFTAKKDAKVQVAKVWNGNRILLVAEVLDSNGKQLSYGDETRLTFDFVPPADGSYVLFVRDRDLYRVDPYTVRLSCLAAECGCTALWRNYGEGHPGTGNKIPALTASGPPKLSATTRIFIENSSGVSNALAVLAVGAAEAADATKFGGLLVVDTLTFVQLPPLPTSGLSVPLWVPNVPDLYCDFCLYLQTVQVDSGATHGLAFSKGLNLVYGR